MTSTIPELVSLFSYGHKDCIADLDKGKCFCPVHEAGGPMAGHKTPSLGLARGVKVPVVFKCYSQDCDGLAIKQAFVDAGADFGQRISVDRVKMLRSKDVGLWQRPITSEMMESRPAECLISQKKRPITYFYQYADEEGHVVFFRCRIEVHDEAGSRKEMRPLGFYLSRDETKTGWAWAEPPVTHFYGHQDLTSRPEDNVLIVEGEKTADAAKKLFADTWVVITWANMNKTPWSVLKDRRVTILPDNDETGRKYVSKITAKIHAIVKDLKIIPIWNHKLPRGWDVADPLPPDVSLADIMGNTVLPEQLDLDTVNKYCRYIRTTKWESPEEMKKAMTTLCKDIAEKQPGRGAWPSNSNCCEYCDCRGVVDRPLAILETPSILVDYVYISGDNKFAQLKSGNIIGPEAFNLTHASTFNKANKLPPAKQYFTEDLRARKVDQLGYEPGYGPVYRKEGLQRLNTWVQPVLEPRPCDDELIKPFFALCKMLFPDEWVRDQIMDWMAFILTHPGETVNWSIIISGVQGCGKDSLFKPLKQMLGNRNCTEVSEIELSGEFWDFASKQLAIFEETAKHGKWTTYNKLKAFLTNDQVLIHRKGVQSFYVPRVTNYAMLTNSESPLPLDEGDRRWFFCVIPMTSKTLANRRDRDPDFFSRFHQMCDNRAAMEGLLHWFHARDISKFNPKAHAPLTEAKKSLIQDSRTAVEYVLDDLIRARSWPFFTGLFTVRQIKQILYEQGMKVTDQKLGKILKADHRFHPMWRAKWVHKIDGVLRNDSDSVWRITDHAIGEMESYDDRKQMRILLARIADEIEPLRGNGEQDSATQRSLWKLCFEEGWVNAERDDKEYYTKNIRMPGGAMVVKESPF